MVVLAFSVAWAAGVLLAFYTDAPPPATVLFAVGSALLAAFLASARRTPVPGLLALALFLGVLRADACAGGPRDTLAAYHGQPVRVEGVIVSDPEAIGAFTRSRLRAERVGQGGQWADASGHVLVTARESLSLVQAREKPYFRYGDRLLLEGVLEAPRPLEDFDYPAYLARQGIRSVMAFPRVTLLAEDEGSAFYRWLYGLRQRLAASIARVVPEPEASLGQAMVLGLRGEMPAELEEAFQVTGTSHILAISGLNTGIVLAVSLALGRFALGRRWHLYLLPPLALVWLYSLVSGMAPPVVRAAIMGTVYLAALFLGRPGSILPALGLAAAVMVAISPNLLWSVSFQLSFAAMAGIALLSEPLGRWLRSLYPAGKAGSVPALVAWAADTVAMTIAATLATLPLTAFYFQRVSLVGLPATALALPPLTLLLVSHTLTGLAGLVSDALARPPGWLAWASTAYLAGVVELFSRLPVASVATGRLAPALVWAYYVLLALLPALPRLRGVQLAGLAKSVAGLVLGLWKGRGVPWWALAPTIAVAALAWLAALSSGPGRLHVVFQDVGQGDAIFIITPSGQHILVDGGPDPLGAARALGGHMPFFDRDVEVVVLTHGHSDHVTGLLEVLRRYSVKLILERQAEYDSPPYQAWRQAVAAEGAAVVQAQPGQAIALDDGVTLHVLGPPQALLKGTESDIDNASVVLRLVYGDTSFLLAGDAFSEGEAALLASGAALDSDVLKVGHHGSRSSSTPGFLERVSPAVAVISAGENNPYGHPHPETLATLRRYVPPELTFLTRDHGTIEVISDGHSLEVRTER